jgi:predicted ribonuclease YlaK
MGNKFCGTKNYSGMTPPVTLEDHPFYGIKLDDDQKAFRDAIWDPEKLIVFCNAKAGTGKTFIATATANLMVEYGRYDGLVYISSPTQEGKLGFLPGEIEDKVAVYSEPFWEALLKLNINPNTAINQVNIMNQKNGNGYIDAITHVYLRGCNFENKVVIIDEAQNYYCDELKKTLTRMSDNCKVVVIGHNGQIDLYHNPENSGFVRYLEHFKDDPRTAVCELKTNYRGWISNHADSLE